MQDGGQNGRLNHYINENDICFKKLIFNCRVLSYQNNLRDAKSTSDNKR